LQYIQLLGTVSCLHLSETCQSVSFPENVFANLSHIIADLTIGHICEVHPSFSRVSLVTEEQKTDLA